jgi:hypothetical protein
MATTEPKATAKFVQITSMPYGAGYSLFALDEGGDIWQFIVGRSEEWERLPRKRTGGPGRPASR